MREVYVDLFNVSGLGDVDFWSGNKSANNEVLLGGRLAFVRRFGLGFGLCGSGDWNLEVNVLVVEVVGVMVHSMELLFTWVSTDRDRTSNVTGGGTSGEFSTGMGSGVVGRSVVGRGVLRGVFGGNLASSFFASNRRGFVGARRRRTGRRGGRRRV